MGPDGKFDSFQVILKGSIISPQECQSPIFAPNVELDEMFLIYIKKTIAVFGWLVNKS